MERRHQKNLEAIFSMEQEEFKKWVASLSDEKIDYVDWLLEQAEVVLDTLILDQSRFCEAKQVLDFIAKK